MSDFAEIVKEGLRLVVRPCYSFAIALTTLLLLITPLPGVMGLDRFREEYRQYIGLVCLFCFVLWVVEAGLFVGEKVWDYLQEQEKKKIVLKRLESLGTFEATMLLRAIENKTQTALNYPDSSDAHSLVTKELLLQALPLSVGKNSRNLVPFVIPDFVWEHINKVTVVEIIRKQTKPKT